jgi:hypothetical protein
VSCSCSSSSYTNNAKGRRKMTTNNEPIPTEKEYTKEMRAHIDLKDVYRSVRAEMAQYEEVMSKPLIPRFLDFHMHRTFDAICTLSKLAVDQTGVIAQPHLLEFLDEIKDKKWAEALESPETFAANKERLGDPLEHLWELVEAMDKDFVDFEEALFEEGKECAKVVATKFHNDGEMSLSEETKEGLLAELETEMLAACGDEEKIGKLNEMITCVKRLRDITQFFPRSYLD